MTHLAARVCAASLLVAPGACAPVPAPVSIDVPPASPLAADTPASQAPPPEHARVPPAPTAMPRGQPRVAFDGAGDARGASGFDLGAAHGALVGAAAAAAACKAPGGPTGTGTVKVVFAPSGTVVLAAVDTPFGGTPVAGCVLAPFRALRVLPFEGPAQAVSKQVTIP